MEKVGGVAGPPAGITRQGEQVAAHWARLSLTLNGALETLRSRGIQPEQATAEDVHAVDMLHMGGLAATDALAAMAGVCSGQHVLDVGAGVGGPARRLAQKYGAHVRGLELSETVHQTAVALTALVRLQERVHHKQGSALALPFPDGSFDVVVMQHVAMQIAEKDTLFAECVRVLKPGGALALHEIFLGEGGEPQFPLAWAMDPTMSSLEPLAACTARLARFGLQAGNFVDQTEEGRRYHAENMEKWRLALAQQQGADGRSIEALTTRLATATSMERNLREGRLQVGMIVYRSRARHTA
jgi:ubiquinone/menaquinone biosynthesis C-methylase UbiE